MLRVEWYVSNDRSVEMYLSWLSCIQYTIITGKLPNKYEGRGVGLHLAYTSPVFQGIAIDYPDGGFASG